MRLLVFALLGAWLAALGCGHRGGPAASCAPKHDSSSGACELAGLVLDRGQQKVWGLDHDWIRCRSWSLARIVDAFFESEQSWWLAQRGASPHESAQLLWVEAGVVQASLAVPNVLELAPGSSAATCWALLQPEPGSERVVSWRPGESEQVLLEVPGAQRLIPGPGGAWAIHPGGMLWWVAQSSPQTAVAWALPAGVRLARSVGAELWIRLDTTGGPWCRVDPDRGPTAPQAFPWAPASIDLGSMRRSPVARAWLEGQSIEPLFEPENGLAGGRTTLAGRFGLNVSSHAPSAKHSLREPSGWALIAPEFVWELGPKGQPVRGQGGFALLKSSFWSRGSNALAPALP